MAVRAPECAVFDEIRPRRRSGCGIVVRTWGGLSAATYVLRREVRMCAGLVNISYILAMAIQCMEPDALRLRARREH
jgi:hypothetical protein